MPTHHADKNHIPLYPGNEKIDDDEIADMLRSKFVSIYKSKAYRAAKQLYYSEKYLEEIRFATSDIEIGHIMATARTDKFDNFIN